MFNHVNDPSYFDDAIAQFAFTYDIYIVGKGEIDDYGNRRLSYTKSTIVGSLQSKGARLSQSKDGNTVEKSYNFYCKNIYRINIGDIIYYQGNCLRVDDVNDYDEWGVRSCHLTMVKLTALRDFADYLKYTSGQEVV